MLTSVEVVRPDEMVKTGVDPVRTFRRSVENRLRPRMNRLRDTVKSVAKYQALSPYFIVEQRSDGDSVTFALENTHPAAVFLLAEEGTKPHIIVQRPHLIPRGQLITWLEKGGSPNYGGGDDEYNMSSVGEVAARVQMILNARPIVIPHPGTEPDVPVINAIAAAEPGILDSAYSAIDYWADRFGVEAAT